MTTEIKKVCENCKHCRKLITTEYEFIKALCDNFPADMSPAFPPGVTPTCNKWEEKDPTLQELRDEIRELKKQVDKKDCDDYGNSWWHITGSWSRCDCCDDCCKCKRRCNRYFDWYTAPGTFYYDPYKVTYIGDLYPSTTGTYQISSGNTSDYNYSWTL